MANQKLQNLLYMVLVAGNFLNSGGYAGSLLAYPHPHAHRMLILIPIPMLMLMLMLMHMLMHMHMHMLMLMFQSRQCGRNEDLIAAQAD